MLAQALPLLLKGAELRRCDGGNEWIESRYRLAKS